MSPEEWLASQPKQSMSPEQWLATQQPEEETTAHKVLKSVEGGIGNLVAGGVRGAGSIGATLLAPVDAAARAMGVQNEYLGRNDRRAAMDAGLQEMGADPESAMYGVGKIGAEIAGTAGIPAGALGVAGKAATKFTPNVAAAIAASPRAQALAKAFTTGGMEAGQAAPGYAGAAENLAIRSAGGAGSAAVQAGAVDPSEAGKAALISGALPSVLKVAGKTGEYIGKGLRGEGSSAERIALAKRAADLGINIPADRLSQSRFTDAMAASLNYIPGSGRGNVEGKMAHQLQKAVSNTYGANTANISKNSVEQSRKRIGSEIDNYLSNNTVTVDQQLRADITQNLHDAANQLSPTDFKIISNQADSLLGKEINGVIDGNAAYNVKKVLDKIGRRNTNESSYARELKKSLMAALDRSLSPADQQGFALARRQYANVKAVEQLATNEADGMLSAARLGNLDGKTPELQELASIAATFVKGRESPHGAMQRVMMGGLGTTAALGGGALVGMAVPVITGLTLGRGLNTLLDSNVGRNLVMPGLKAPRSISPLMQAVQPEQLMYRAAPVLSAQ